MKYLFALAMFCFISQLMYGQCNKKVFVYTTMSNNLIVGVDNCISILSAQGFSLSEDQVKASLYTPYRYLNEKEPMPLSIKKEYGKFWIHPDSVGFVEIKVSFHGEVETVTVKVRPIEAVVRLSRFQANTEEKIKANEFRQQRGLIPFVECCGFDAKCNMVEYEIIRIGINNSVSRVKNKGARFEEEGLKLVDEAKPGDFFIFRNIYYICPGSDKQRSEDMIFELE